MTDVVEELNDPRYLGRTHGSRATYAKKCHGPLCRKAERDRGRNRNKTVALRLGKTYEAAVMRRKYDRDALLEAIIAWHRRDLAVRKLNTWKR